MPTATDQLYAQRLNRYVTAMRNQKPDRVPVRPFAAEFTATFSGHTAQQVTHDYNQAFDSVIACCKHFDWDAAVPNMVYVWTGLAQAAGLRYYAIPGIDVGPEVGFQYREPDIHNAWMLREEYDELIEDTVGFLFNRWLPRISAEYAAGSYRRDVSLIKSAWAMANYFNAFGPQIQRMKEECGTVSAISGMLKAPLDILADKFRGYIGLAFDLKEVPDKVEKACHALMPHLGFIALSGLDPSHNIPIPIWMHRGCVPFISHDHFNRIYWPTLKPIVEAIWAQGNQTLFYAEGKWDAHLDAFNELPAGSIVYHMDRGDPQVCAQKLGAKFSLSGGVTNALLAFGTPDEVKDRCKFLIDTCGQHGGYIMDASAIMQNDATVQNVNAMTCFTRDYGVYSATPNDAPPPAPPEHRPPAPEWPQGRIPPGVCIPWQKKDIPGDPALCKTIWENVDALAYFYIWHLVLSF